MELPKGPFVMKVFTLAFLVMVLSHLPYSTALKCYRCTEYLESPNPSPPGPGQGPSPPSSSRTSCIQSGVPFKRGPEKTKLDPEDCSEDKGCLKIILIDRGIVRGVTRGCGQVESKIAACVLEKKTGIMKKDGCAVGFKGVIDFYVQQCTADTKGVPADTDYSGDYMKVCACYGDKCNGGNSLKWTVFGTGLMMAIGIVTSALLA